MFICFFLTIPSCPSVTNHQPTSDKRIPTALDIITCILSRPKAKEIIKSNPIVLNEMIDNLIQSLQEHMQTDEAYETLSKQKTKTHC